MRKSPGRSKGLNSIVVTGPNRGRLDGKNAGVLPKLLRPSQYACHRKAYEPDPITAALQVPLKIA
jgi:hypothetical protein